MKKRFNKISKAMLTAAFILSLITVPAMAEEGSATWDGTETIVGTEQGTLEENNSNPHATHKKTEDAVIIELTLENEPTKYVQYWQCNQENCGGAYYYDDGTSKCEMIGDENALEKWKEEFFDFKEHNVKMIEQKTEPKCQPGVKEYWECVDQECESYFYVNDEEKIQKIKNLEEWKDEAGKIEATEEHDYSIVDTEKIMSPRTSNYQGIMEVYKRCSYCSEKNTFPEHPCVPDIRINCKDINCTYNEENPSIEVEIQDENGNIINPDQYEAKLEDEKIIKSAGTKKDVSIIIHFKEICSRYSGDWKTTANCIVKPSEECSLVIGKPLNISEIVGNAKKATFELPAKYRNKNKGYCYTLSRDKKKITTDILKMDCKKADPYMDLNVVIDNVSYPVHVKLELPKVTFTHKKVKGGYKVYFSYKYPKNLKVTIRVKGLSAANKDLDKYTKKHPKNVKNAYLPISTKTAQKVMQDNKYLFTVSEKSTNKNWNRTYDKISVKK